MTYLEEHCDAVMEVLRHSLDQVLDDGVGWSTTFGTRSRDDARKLWAMLEQAVFDLDTARTDLHRIELAVVHEPHGASEQAGGSVASAWGVCIRLAAPQHAA